jgi:cation diffusion facilitator family transporter
MVFAASTTGYTYEHATQSIIWAFGVNVGIALLKFGAWLISQSPSMFSEGLHSSGDAFNSIALYVGLKQSNRPPDQTHPFGYGLEASVWAVLACAFLLVFSVIAITEGWHKLSAPPAEPRFMPGFEFLNPFMFSVIVLVISIALETMAVRKAAIAILEERSISAKGPKVFFEALKHVHAVVGPTTRFVFYEDTIALMGAVIALVAISLSEFAVELNILPPEMAHMPDVVASILIGVLLMGMSIYLFSHNRGILTGIAAAPQVEQKVTDLVKGIEEVSEVHDLVTIDQGPAGLMIRLKVEVEPNIPVKDVDDLVDRIKEKIKSRIQNVNDVSVEVRADESDQEWSDKFYTLVEQGREEEIINAREATILKNVYHFTQVTVEDVMVPRIDVIAIDLSATIAEAADLIIGCGHSRLPVYEEDRDNIHGMIHSMEVFEALRKNELEQPLKNIVREMDFYPENKSLSDLLEDFKRNKIQMAAVMDEYGGFAGIVTIEDLMEEIVGEIWDEHDDEEIALEFESPQTVLLDGMHDIDDVNEKLGLNIPTEDFTTVAGFVFGALGREPEVGDTVNFEDLIFTVTEMDGTRITALKLFSPIPFPQPEIESQPETPIKKI